VEHTTSCVRQISPVQIPLILSLRSILILSTHLRLCLPGGLFPSDFSTNILYTSIFVPIHATCLAHLIILDLIILIILSEEYKLRTPYYAVFSSLLSHHLSSVQIFSSAPCSRISSVYVPPLMSRDQVPTHTEPQAKL
jgi:hypothetical protein